VGEADEAPLSGDLLDAAQKELTVTPAWLVETVADYLISLDAGERSKFKGAVDARVLPALSASHAR
jgi:hypothetical protein